MATPLLQAILPLTQTPTPPHLGPGPRAGVREEAELRRTLDALDLEQRLPARRAELVRAFLLLWHDHLDSAHRIVQSPEDADANLLHAILHRREPDYGNSRYWFRRVGSHPAYAAIGSAVGNVLARTAPDPSLSRLIRQNTWDPLGFVDVCEQLAPASDNAPRLGTARGVQAAEMLAVLEYLCEDGSPATTVGPVRCP